MHSLAASPVFAAAVHATLAATARGTWLARVYGAGLPRVLAVCEGVARDVTATAPSVAHVLQARQAELLDAVRTMHLRAPDASLCQLLEGGRLASPHDLSAVKARTWSRTLAALTLQACGVVFVRSLLERVVEEAAHGDRNRAAELRASLSAAIGEDLLAVRPGSPQALELLRILTQERGLSRHYLEVGLGTDAEVFTKAQPMSTVGFGAAVGIHPQWNNPEPELVLVVNRYGETVGCVLGNDVNLRDVEGRSALLLGKAKDNNGSCAIGPLIRLFDETFSIDDARQLDISLEVVGLDGFAMRGVSSMREIGRDLLDLVDQTIHSSHQYPDGLFLFTGTMFAPVDDRDPEHGRGKGFTHHYGDIVAISTPPLGMLINDVASSDRILPWTYGTVAYLADYERTVRAKAS